jgi:hypothetical protein
MYNGKATIIAPLRRAARRRICGELYAAIKQPEAGEAGGYMVVDRYTASPLVSEAARFNRDAGCA